MEKWNRMEIPRQIKLLIYCTQCHFYQLIFSKFMGAASKFPRTCSQTKNLLQTINYSRSDRYSLGHQIQKVLNASISPICNTVGYLERMPHSWPVTVSITPERMYTCLSRRHIAMGIFWLLNSNLGRRALKRNFFQNLNVLKFMYFWSYVQY